jgi:class 3 adenylate cyclase
MVGRPPSGTVTFLLRDLEGSTRLCEHDPDAMRAAMRRHDEIVEHAIEASHGFLVARMGDGVAAARCPCSHRLSSANPGHTIGSTS